MAQVVVTHWVHPEVASYLAGFCEPRVPSATEGVWPGGRVTELAATADGLITCMADTVDDGFLARCPRLRVISATLKGYDNFDADACTRRGVWLTVLPDLLSHPRTLFTPHLGSAVDSARRDMSLAAARQVEQALRGQRPDHAVNDPR
jgi:lactate dehydrogenase-like 2-hydroxyacid dehydrogenase